jgi:hypothetical protein
MITPEIKTRITVFCDCTDEFVLHTSLYKVLDDDWPAAKVIVTNFSPIASQEKLYSLFEEMDKDEQYLIVLGNMQEVMALCTILANSLIDSPKEDVPVVDPTEVRVWEVFDNENILLSMPDGRVLESSYDKALRPIVADYQAIQARAFIVQNPEGEAETTQFVETEGAVKDGEAPTKTVEEVLAERKQKAKKIKENLKDKKNE